MLASYYSAIALLLLNVRSRRKQTPVNENVPHGSPRPRLMASRVRNVLIGRKGRVWVKVETGLVRGLWLHLNLAREEKYWLGYHESEVQELLRKLIVPGTVAYDVGAHIGFFSMAMARLMGPEGQIFAFEPDPESAERIGEHVLRNNLQRGIRVLREAVWSYSCRMGIPFKRGNIKRDHGGISADGYSPPLADGECISVPSITLDSLVQEGYPIPDIVKIDVEGGECEVLKGGRELFSQAKTKLICEMHSREAVNWIIDWLKQKGYASQSLTPHDTLPRIIFARRG